ncbi:MAG: hypothetical protein ABIP75_18820 [Pyrinomonadaceae bacterium]
MYCSSCGLELPQELSYCNRCGNNLRPLGPSLGELPMRFKGALPVLATVITLVTVCGFGLAFGLIMALIDRGLNFGDGGGALAALILAITLAIDWMLVRLLMRILNLAPVAKEVASPPRPKNLPEPSPHRLDEPRQPVDSVTDHTTRTLPVEYVERGKANAAEDRATGAV